MSNRKSYDRSLEQLNDALQEMGDQAAQAVAQAYTLLQHKDDALARRIIEGDKRIDERERNIEHQCLELLLRQQPVASDLRRVSTALKLVTDIERIGDHAADLAEISLVLDAEWAQYIPVQAELAQMEGAALKMVQNAILAFVNGDMAQADAVVAQDDTVDQLFNSIKTELAGYIARNPGEIDAALDLLMVIKYVERLGDHAVNIAEWVHFLKTGMYRGQQIV